jgi:hypothetical protein
VWRFWIRLPKPDKFVKINPVDADVTGPSTPPVKPLAVGIRLIYEHWDGSAMPILLNGQPVLKPNNDPVVFKFNDLGGNDRWDLDLEYTGPVRDDPEHEDAINCFASLMRGLEKDWSISFPGHARDVTHRNDCKAAIAWVK